MLKRYETPDCRIDVALTFVNRYNLLIVHHLLSGAKRFGELKRAVGESTGGVSQKVLAEHLRIMAEHGLIARDDFGTVPPRVEYSLTELGKTLEAVLDALRKWGELYGAAQP